MAPKEHVTSVAVLALLLASAASSWAAPGEPVQDAVFGGSVDGGPVCKLLLLGPMSGPLAESGVALINGAKLAVEEFGSKTASAEVFSYDSACDPNASANATQDAVAKHGIVGIVGDWCSGASLASSKIANAKQIPMISTGATSPRLTTDGGKYFNRVVPHDVYQGGFLASLAAKWFKRMYVIFSLDAYGESIAHEIFLAITKPPLSEQSSVVGSMGIKGDFVPGSLGAVLTAKPDAVILATGSGATYGSAVLIAMELRDKGWQGTLLGPDTLVVDSYLEGGADSPLEGAYAVALYMGTDEFKAKYEKRFGGSDVPQGAATAYDATRIFLKYCAANDKVLPGEAVQAKLTRPGKNTVVLQDGATGTVVFTPDGDDATVEYSVFKAHDGHWGEVVEGDEQPQ